MGTGPHPSDPRAVAAAAEIIELIEGRRRGSGAEHVGSTAEPNLVGKNFVDLQITADPEDVPSIADSARARVRSPEGSRRVAAGTSDARRDLPL